MLNIIEYAQDLQLAESASDIESIISQIAKRCDMEFYLFGVSIPISFSRSYTVIYNNYPTAWRKHYDESNYVELDPVVKHCYTSTKAVYWDELECNYSSKQESAFFTEAKEYGLRSGISVPVHGSKSEIGIFSLASCKAHDDFSQSHLTELSLISQTVASMAFSKLIEVESRHIETESHQLTDREKDVIYWAAEGKTTWEIALILGCSERTVYFHLNNAIKKLGVVNRYQAISKAVLHGHVHPTVSKK